MLKVNHTLVLTVSALALSAGNVSAAFPNPPLASVLCTKLHTSYNSQSMQSSAPARQVAESGLLVDGNFQNQLSTVMFGLDPNIQVAKESILDQDPRVKPEDDNSFLVASVCFITDTGECQGVRAGGGSEDKPVNPDVIDPDSVARCKKEGYNLTSCNSVQEPFNRCPYNNSYFEKCVCRSDLKTCTKPQYGVGESCGGKYASCQTDNPRACKEDGYTNTCPSGQKLKKSPRCQYDSSFGICCSPSCPQYTSTTSSSYGTNGTDGCGYACYYTCQMNCPSGTTESNPGGCGGSTSNGCGNKTCYYAYKSCCTPSCSYPWSLNRPSGNYTSQVSNCSGIYCYRSCTDTCSSGGTTSRPYGTYTSYLNDCGNTCYKSCTNTCSSGGSMSRPSGAYTSYQNDCGNTCYQNCTPQQSETGCTNGTYSCSDGCNGTRRCCNDEHCYHQISVDGNPVYLHYLCYFRRVNDYNPTGYGCFPTWKDSYSTPGQILETATMNATGKVYRDKNQRYEIPACSTKGPIVDYIRGASFSVDGKKYINQGTNMENILPVYSWGGRKFNRRGNWGEWLNP